MLFAVPTLACAESLVELIEIARNSEPGYQSVRNDVAAAQAKQRQARGAFLPQVNLSANTQANSRDYTSLGSPIPEQHDSYNSRSTQLSMSLPLWRYGDIAAWRQWEAAVAQAERQLDHAGQELLLRVMSAWFDLLAARDQQAFAQMQERAADKAWETARRGAQLGMTSATQLEAARAENERAGAERVGGEAEFGAKLAALEQLVGSMPPPTLPFLRADVVLPTEDGGELEDWTERANSGNLALAAAQRAFEAASEEVSKEKGGHAPSLELVSTISRNRQAVGGFPGQSGYDIQQGSIGFQLNVPLYSGGIQSARVDEAIARRERARFELEGARRSAALGVRQAWWSARAARARIKAGERAIEAAGVARRAAEVGARTGLKSEYDSLNAGKDWLAARRDWSRAVYDLLLSQARLVASIGQLGGHQVALVDSGFASEEPQATGEQARLAAISVGRDQ